MRCGALTLLAGNRMASALGEPSLVQFVRADAPVMALAEQRRIIERETGHAPAHTPQVWALYKEVQGYCESGMRVPDDVLLLWSDDNWGNLRRLPTAEERSRSGGAGVYYHFDYVGGPRSYKWINTTPLPKTWEQMHLAWQHEATRLWMLNVGDLKPMEVPMEFFLRYAWNPTAWPAERLPTYLKLWAMREFGEFGEFGVFGPAHAEEIAEIVAQYTRFNGRRKPEQLSPETLKACATVNELHVTVARNRLHAQQGRRSTAALAERARALFALDAELTSQYHQDLAGGKWNHQRDGERAVADRERDQDPARRPTAASDRRPLGRRACGPATGRSAAARPKRRARGG